MQFYLICFLISFSAFAAPEVNNYSLKALVNRALERSPEVKASQFHVEAQKAKVNQAGRWDDPSLELGSEKREEPLGNTQFTKVALSQNIPRPGRIGAREDAAARFAELSGVEQQTFELQLKGKILELIYLFRTTSEKAAHARERYDRFKTLETYLRSRPFVAPQKRAEAMIVKSKLMILHKELREQEARRQVSWNDLNLYLGFEQEPKLSVPWYKTAPQFVLGDLIKKVQSNNPELRKQTLRLKAQESELRLAQYESWPGLTLTAGYADGTGTLPEKNYGLGVSFPLPVFNGNRGNIKVAEALKETENSRLRWTQEKIVADLKSIYEHYQAAAEAIADLSPDKISGQEKEMQDIDASFKRGQVDLITFLEADTQHTESLNAILEAQTHLVTKLTELLLFVGEAPQSLEN